MRLSIGLFASPAHILNVLFNFVFNVSVTVASPAPSLISFILIQLLCDL